MPITIPDTAIASLYKDAVPGDARVVCTSIKQPADPEPTGLILLLNSEAAQQLCNALQVAHSGRYPDVIDGEIKSVEPTPEWRKAIKGLTRTIVQAMTQSLS